MGNKFRHYDVRVGKGRDFVLIDLMDSVSTTFTKELGAILLTKKHWKQVKKFIADNPDFEKDIEEDKND